jgi:hypothetical protein
MKVFLTRHRLATRESVAALATDNLLYAASIAAMVALGVIVVRVHDSIVGGLARRVAIASARRRR